ncbi:glycoside hydrolase/deacetylase [Rhizoclosmatium globosum]|uniref:Glycoside hydrolase/deacetylase n=1 Tax=Rhizoclosmatium globosum TaxID=329046 RepID=A0A1Y2CGB1_9FUNG|nr:glycoside hydrolase/deacetylase [Rhizoclosmatium globosum]|eukprot:ORY45874.1 glycoside hydrolase/deacetylase [Rhizoclosmatium globosum]
MELMIGGAAMLLGSIGATLYGQPHHVIAILVRQFPRVVWCLSSSVSTVVDQQGSPSAPSPSSASPSSPSAPSIPSQPQDEATSAKPSSQPSLAYKELQTIYSQTKSSVSSSTKQLTRKMSTFLTRKGTAKEGTKDADPQPVPVPQPPQPLPGVKEKLMALTIDDSPSQHTSEILDVLKQHNAKATFFIIGTHVDSTPNGRQLLQRMIAEGHELGNHTMYDRPTISLTHEVFEDELITVDKLLEEYQPSTPRRVKWFRPGSGVFSQDMIDTAEKHGYTTVLGCRFPVDTTSRDPRLNAWHVSAGVHPGAVVVLHDGRAWTAETLRVLVPIVAGKGFRFVNAGELLKVAGGVSVRVVVVVVLVG